MFLVHLRRPFLAIRKRHLDYPAVPAYRCLAAITVAAGIYGQVLDWSAIGTSVSRMNVPMLFGAVLYCAITARFFALGRRVESPPAAVYQLSRHLSRLVYLLLYGLLAIGISMATVRHFLYSVAAGPDWQSKGIPAEVFRPYLAHGVVALILIRLEAATLLHYFHLPSRELG